MKVDSITIQNFKNLKNISISPTKDINIIYGDNAQGKTNLLEAVWLFSGARSFRSSSEKEFIRTEAEFAALDISFQSNRREQTAALRFAENKRSIFLNEIKQTSYQSLLGVFSVVIFSPDHLSLVKDGPEIRRNMLDTSLSQAYPKYAKALENYNKALRQRNKLLKDMLEKPKLREMLSLWDDHIINYGAYLSVIRARYCTQLGEQAALVYSGISQGKETLCVEYRPSVLYPEGNLELNVFQTLLQQELEKTKEEDLRYGNTSVGPHRDDVIFLINDKSAKQFASQGQQRSVVLALKLAECAILEEENGESPVVMLDDVMSELDQHRRAYLLNELVGKQTFITCCDNNLFQELEKGKIFEMVQGCIGECKEME